MHFLPLLQPYDIFIYLGYNTMVAGFISNHTYMHGKQHEIKQLEDK